MSATTLQIPKPDQPQNDKPAGKTGALGPGHAVVGTSLIVLLVELGRSGALAQYKDFLQPFIAWGPSLVIILVLAWLGRLIINSATLLMAKYAPPLINSHQNMAAAVQELSATVKTQATRQEDLVLATQVNSDKIDHVTSILREVKECMEKRRSTDAG